MGIWRPHIEIQTHRKLDGMQAFYVNALLRSLVFSMIGIFTPVFIYTETLARWGSMSSSVAAVAGYYLIVRAMVIAANIPSAKIIEKIGFRKSVIVSVVLLIGYLGLLISAKTNYYLLVPAALMMGLAIPMYWISRGSVIALDSKKKQIGKQVSFLAIMERVAGVAGPVAAGLIIEKWGFPLMYFAAFIILVVSVFPLLSMPHHVHRNGVSVRGYLEWLKSRRFSHQAVSSVGRLFDDFGFNLAWPLALLLMGVNYSELGVFYSGLTVLTIVLRYASGRVFDKLYQKKGWEDESLFGIATLGTAITWVGRLFVGSIWGAFLLDGGMMIFGTTYRNISSGYDALGGKRMHEIAYFSYKEITYSIAAVVFCALWMVGAYYGVWKELLFLSAALWVILGTVQARESNL